MGRSHTKQRRKLKARQQPQRDRDDILKMRLKYVHKPKKRGDNRGGKRDGQGSNSERDG